MNTRKLRKVLLTLCSALLLVSLSVGMTIAYLTDTDSVKNTFTVGQVGICLDEKDVDDSKTSPITDCEDHDHKGRDKANKYHLMPGHDYEKDPTIWVDPDSEDAYLRVKIAINNAEKLDALFKKHSIGADNVAEKVLPGLDLNLWTVTSSVTDDVRNYVFEYKGIINGDTAPIKLFQKVDIPDEFDNADIEALGDETTISITAEAIQVAGFENNREGAWAAFDTQKAAANQ